MPPPESPTPAAMLAEDLRGLYSLRLHHSCKAKPCQLCRAVNLLLSQSREIERLREALVKKDAALHDCAWRLGTDLGHANDPKDDPDAASLSALCARVRAAISSGGA